MPWLTMRWSRFLAGGAALTFAAALAADSQETTIELKPMRSMSKTSSRGAAIKEAIWKFDHGRKSKPIFVCWMKLNPSQKMERQMVRDAIRRTWESASALDFGGDWPLCRQDAWEIRIRTMPDDKEHHDVAPSTDRIGSFLSEKGTDYAMNLNFYWSGCQGYTHEECVRWTAVHEFGHALGLTHENSRDDLPDVCAAWNIQFYAAHPNMNRRPYPNIKLGPWDGESVMNYCELKINGRWNNNGTLSKYDVEAIQLLYCPKKDPDCRSYSTGDPM